MYSIIQPSVVLLARMVASVWLPMSARALMDGLDRNVQKVRIKILSVNQCEQVDFHYSCL